MRKAEGLEPEVLAARLEPGALTIGGLVHHLTQVERWWFRDVFASEPGLEYPWSEEDPDADFRIPPGMGAGELVDGYRAEVELSRAIVARSELDEMSCRPGGPEVSLRWILLHMIEETARHAGHADLIRESIDGATGD